MADNIQITLKINIIEFLFRTIPCNDREGAEGLRVTCLSCHVWSSCLVNIFVKAAPSLLSALHLTPSPTPNMQCHVVDTKILPLPAKQLPAEPEREPSEHSELWVKHKFRDCPVASCGEVRLVLIS